jgi:hypothetical protein
MVGYPIPRKADLACTDSWEPSLKALEQLTVKRGTSDLQKQMGASLCPTHVLSFAEPSSNKSIHGTFDRAGRNSPSFSSPSAVIDYTRFVLSNVPG